MGFRFPSGGWFLVIVLVCMKLDSCDGRVRFPAGVTPPSAVFAYGDSIVDQGNNNQLQTTAKANFPPYGKDLPGGFPTGRFCNGRTPPDLIAEELGITKMVPAYLDPNLSMQDFITGVSFASGAAGFDPRTSQLAAAIPLVAQLEYLRAYKEKLAGAVGPQRAAQIVSDGLHVVAAGSDDLMNTYFGFSDRRLRYDIASYTDFVTSSASAFIRELYGLGARRVAFLGIPSIGCLPSQRTIAGGLTRNCNNLYNEAAELLNSKLSHLLDSLTQTLPQSRVVFIDIYDPLLQIIQNPQKFGFEVSDRGCCGTGVIEVVGLCRNAGTCADTSKYVFWDSYHPSERTYKIIVRQVLQSYINRFV